MATEEAIEVQFTAQLRKSPAKGGWSYVIWPESATYPRRRNRQNMANLRLSLATEPKIEDRNDARCEHRIRTPVRIRRRRQ